MYRLPFNLNMLVAISQSMRAVKLFQQNSPVLNWGAD